MSPMVTAILLLCTTGDPQVAQMIEREAIRQDIDPAWALTVGLMESGLQPNNPMGVRGCYGDKARKKGTRTCIRLGVESLHNRLWSAYTTRASAVAKRECRGTGELNGCRALIVYNGSKKKYEYARRGVALYRKVHKLALKIRPET